MARKEQQVVLKITGARATRGVSLSDFETFIDSFLAAVRDLDREVRGAELKRSGHPEKRAAAVTALRLVGFKIGSGIATLEPEIAEDEDQLFEGLPPALEGLGFLVDRIDGDDPIPDAVSDDLERAVRAFGADGSVDIRMPKSMKKPPVKITESKVAELRGRASKPRPNVVTSVSGRLHLLDVEPDRIGIRDPEGVDWSCHYPEGLEPTILALAGQVVWAAGRGERQSSRRGAMEIERVEPLDQGTQSRLFTGAPVSLEALGERHGIAGPQPLSELGARTWDDEDDLFLAALTE